MTRDQYVELVAYRLARALKFHLGVAVSMSVAHLIAKETLLDLKLSDQT